MASIKNARDRALHSHPDTRRGGRVVFDAVRQARVSIIGFWLLAAVALISPVYWVLDPLPPMHFVKASVRPESNTPGGRVTAYYNVEVTRDASECSVDVERAWTDAKGFRWPATTAHLPYGLGPQVIALTMSIPMDSAPGMSTIANTVRWACNPFQQIFPRRLGMPPLMVDVVR